MTQTLITALLTLSLSLPAIPQPCSVEASIRHPDVFQAQALSCPSLMERIAGSFPPIRRLIVMWVAQAAFPGLFSALGTTVDRTEHSSAPKANFIVFDEAKEMGIAAAREAAAVISANNAIGEITVFMTPTESTPYPFYDELARLHNEEGLDFSRVHTFQLTEYWTGSSYKGDWKSHEQSDRFFMEKWLFSRVNIPKENIHSLNGQTRNPMQESLRYEEELKEFAPHGAHIGFGGTGSTGHVAYNEGIVPIGRQDQLDSNEFWMKAGMSNEFLLGSTKGEDTKYIDALLQAHLNFRSASPFKHWLKDKLHTTHTIDVLAATIRNQSVTIYVDASNPTRYKLVQDHLKTLLFPFEIHLKDARNVSRSRTRLVQLTLNTIIDRSIHFTDPNDIPTQALTIGLGTLMDSQRIRILASGEKKKATLQSAADGSASSENPVSILLQHPNHAFLVDRAAAPASAWSWPQALFDLKQVLNNAESHVRQTDWGHFTWTPIELLEAVLRRLPMIGSAVMVLGSGRGDDTLASAIFGAGRVVAVEGDADLVEQNRELLKNLMARRRKHPLLTPIQIFQTDFMSGQVSFGKADIVLYTDSGSRQQQQLEQKLLSQLKRDALVVVLQAPTERVVPLFTRLVRVHIPGMPAHVEVYRRPGQSISRNLNRQS